MKKITPILALLLINLLPGCTKDITVNLPQAEPKIVVEAQMEQNQPPFVLLSKSMGYFEPTDLNTLQNLYLKGATVTLSDGSNTVTLDEICTSSLPDSLLQLLAPQVGISYENLKNLDICFYTSLSITGEIGKTYTLTVNYNGEVVTSTAKIPPLIRPNYYFWKPQPGYDDYGYLWFNLTDPPQLGDNYRIFVKRQGKDNTFVPVLGSVYNDDFSNGLTFDFYVARGHLPNDTTSAEVEGTDFYFKRNDTLIVKFCTIDRGVYNFYRTFEQEVFNNGNPFASPTTIQSNINNGLGVWACYGAAYDTIIATN
jgi:hypothetical protein